MGLGHIVRVIAPQNDMLRTILPNQVFQLPHAEHHRVKEQAPQIARGTLLNAAATVRTRGMSMIHSARIGGQEAAPVRDAEFESRQRIEYAIEDQVTDRYRRSQWITNDVDEIVVSEPSAVAESVRMQEHQDAEFL